MKLELDELQPVQTHCPNCGRRCTGYRSRDQTTRISCGLCGVKMVSKRVNKRTTDMRITAPKGYVS